MKPVTTALIRIRKEKGWSQTKLAKESTIPLNIIREIERNPKEPPTGREVRAILKAMDVPKSVLDLYRLETKDVPKRKRDLYKTLNPAVSDMVKQLIKMK